MSATVTNAHVSDLRAEREAIAACVVLEGGHSQVLAWTKPEQFALSAHLHIMEGVVDLARDGQVITYATLCDHLRQKGRFTSAVEETLEGCLEYPIKDAEAAAKIVAKMATLRGMRDILSEHVEMIDDGRAEPERSIGAIVSDLLTINVQSSGRSRHVSEIGQDVDVHVARLLSGDITALETGIPSVDYAIGGLQLTEMLGLTGPPGSLKSIIKTRMNQLNAMKGFGVVSYILEMNTTQELLRGVAIAAEGDVNAKLFRGGPGVRLPTPEEVERFNYHKSRVEQLPIWSDNSKFGLMEILADAERRVQENDIKLVTLDYAQLVTAGDGTNRTAELERISQAFRIFANKNNVAVVMIVRLDKAGALNALRGGELTGAELHGSSSFHYDFSSLVTLHFDKPWWLCGCDLQKQIEWNDEEEKWQSKHQVGVRRYCHQCRGYVEKSDRRIGSAFVLKARDGDTFTKVDLMLEGASLRICELGAQLEEPEPEANLLGVGAVDN